MAEIEAGPGGLAAAARRATPGDTVILSGGTYRERLVADKPGVTWKVAPDRVATIDGGWKGDDQGGDKNPLPPTVALTAPGVTVQGVRIVNAPGFGATISADECALLDCELDNIYGSGVVVNGAGEIRDITIEGNRITRTVMRWTVNRIAGGGGIVAVRTTNGKIRNNKVIGTWGEGIDLDRGSRELLCEGNLLAFTAHLGIYIMRSVGTTVRNNIIYRVTVLEEDVFRGKDANAGAGIVIGDEVSDRMSAFPNSARSTVEGNLIVNCGVLFQVRSNTATQGYDTWLDPETRIVGNTFVGGPFTRAGVQIGATRPHGAAVFERNLWVMDNAPNARVAVTQGEQSPALIWRNNGWTVPTPAASFRGPGDAVLPDRALANAKAEIRGTWERTNFNPAAYQPTAIVPAGWGWRGKAEPEPPPSPPVPDVTEVLERLATAQQQLEAIAAAGNAAAEAFAIIQGHMAVMALAQQDAADNVAAARAILAEQS